MINLAERDILMWLNSLNVSDSNIEILIDYFDDLRELWTVESKTINSVKSIKPNVITNIIKNRNQKYIEDLFLKLKLNNIEYITIFDENYPEKLKNITDKPKILYKKGNIIDDDNLSIGIVGARKATDYGKWACEKFTRELVNMGVTIVSGVALGIDAVAHKTALEEGGRTIGVLGNGLDNVYPYRHSSLYNDIIKNGALITEFPLGTPPLAYNFPQRNRIIAGLSLGVIVIEAKEKSGSLITAHCALDQGKDVFALPGNINSIYSGGTNKLIKDGAKSLLDIEDIMEEIYELRLHSIDTKKKGIDYTNLSETEIKVLEVIEDGPVHCDIIVYKTGIDISNVISILTILELKGVIRELSSRTFTIY